MNAFVWLEEKWALLCEKTLPARTVIRNFWREFKHIVQVVWTYVYRLRPVLMAIPVAILAIWLMLWCSPRMPDLIGIYLLDNGQFLFMVPKQIALIGSLAVTAGCILLMLCTKKPLYPWLISIFTLVLPVFFMFTNMYPC